MYGDILKYDSEFTESMFKSKVDNIFIMLFTNIMTKEIVNVKHVLSEELYDRFFKEVENLKNKNYIHMYEMLNVASTEITNVEITDEKMIVKVTIVSKAVDYIMDENGNIISGQNQDRITKNNYLTLTKKINSKDIKTVRKCPGCGASIDANYSGVCEYCDTTYNAIDYDWILEDIE